MSADRWDTCPQCFDRAQKKWEQDMTTNSLEYGHIDSDEWLKRSTELSKCVPNPEDEVYQTFREDYEWYISEGTLHGIFSGGCKVCGLSIDHKIEPIVFYDPAESS